MAHNSPPNIDLDTMNRSKSMASLASTNTMDSSRSVASSRYSGIGSRKRRGIIGKIETGFQSIFKRFSRTRTSLTEMECQILSTLTNFNRDEVVQWHEKFLADCPNGYMTRKQFIAMYKSLFPRGDAERFARHVFRAFDTDKSNTVDFHEFLIGLSMTSSNSSPQTKLEWTFHVFDIDGNGLLTRRECLEVIETIVRFNYSLQNDPSNSDIDQTIKLAKRSMMNIFDNVGERPTDKLTMSQFVQGCLKDVFISQLLVPDPSLTNTGDSPLSTPV